MLYFLYILPLLQVKATVLTPPSTPVNEPETAPEPQGEQATEKNVDEGITAPLDSPPLSSTPVNGNILAIHYMTM